MDEQSFRIMVSNFAAVGDRLTSYSSKKDRALLVAKLVRFAQTPRVGAMIPDLSALKQPASNTDLVDVTNVESRGIFDLLSIGHFYYGHARAVLMDLDGVLRRISINKRFGPPRFDSQPSPHWTLR